MYVCLLSLPPLPLVLDSRTIKEAHAKIDACPKFTEKERKYFRNTMWVLEACCPCPGFGPLLLHRNLDLHSIWQIKLEKRKKENLSHLSGSIKKMKNFFAEKGRRGKLQKEMQISGRSKFRESACCR